MSVPASSSGRQAGFTGAPATVHLRHSKEDIMNAAIPASTREQLLAQAQKLIRSRGYHGFSYRDLAAVVGVKTSSIHYYFPCKDDLVNCALKDYSDHARASLQAIDPKLPARERLQRYAELMESHACQGDQLCMGTMLAADMLALPEEARAELQKFFRVHEEWIAGVLADGKRDGTLRFAGTPEDTARTVFATLQGCLLVARLFKVPPRMGESLATLYMPEGEAKPAPASDTAAPAA
jgi:Transcriptional regulator